MCLSNAIDKEQYKSIVVEKHFIYSAANQRNYIINFSDNLKRGVFVANSKP